MERVNCRRLWVFLSGEIPQCTRIELRHLRAAPIPSPAGTPPLVRRGADKRWVSRPVGWAVAAAASLAHTGRKKTLVLTQIEPERWRADLALPKIRAWLISVVFHACLCESWGEGGWLCSAQESSVCASQRWENPLHYVLISKISKGGAELQFWEEGVRPGPKAGEGSKQKIWSDAFKAELKRGWHWQQDLAKKIKCKGSSGCWRGQESGCWIWLPTGELCWQR